VNAGELVNELAHQGIQLWSDGDQLRFRAPKGVITPELKSRLKAHKPQILDVLRKAIHYGIQINELRELAGDDWPEIENDPDTLNSFAHAIATRRMRESGRRPGHYTEVSTCKGCGIVWLWQGASEHVEGCPWCFNRVKGVAVPHPEKGAYSGDSDHLFWFYSITDPSNAMGPIVSL
jgi:hypothetical protein